MTERYTYLRLVPSPYVIFASTSRPPDVAHVMNETRPSPFFALFRFRVLGECSALWGEREGVIWSICVAWAVKYLFKNAYLEKKTFALPKC